MKQQNIHQVLQQKYQYNRHSPQFTSVDGKYKVFKGKQKQISISVSIKLLLSSIDLTLNNYLNKLKSTKSQQVIKVYEIISETSFLVVVTEQVVYGTIATALANCKKLDDSDAVWAAKYLLTGYLDLARNGVEWYGTPNDIQITQTGMKLSWNNTMPISAQFSNTFRQVLQQMSTQKIPQTQQRLLPFPQSKNLKQLFRLSQTSASQISISPIMKKKDKYLKKKFKQYLLIRETKIPGQYFDETIYLGVHKDYEFVRIKAYKKGYLNSTVLELNKTKNTFTKIIEVIEQGMQVYLVSAYSNDGTLQSYVQRLKAAGIQLKQDQIEFFFFSMFEPLKAIQESSIKSLNTSLHIKNIYIESGIPKIGEPIPINQEMKQKLRDRADVPDFYHKGYKDKPQTSDPTYDTYSLGVLLYKLMFTEYPIFPNGKVHIPTTPSFSPRLIKTVRIFLDEGNNKLADLQKKIQVSENVLKQVKKNKETLLSAKKLQQKKQKQEKKKYKKILVDEDEDVNNQKKDDQEQKDKLNQQQQDDDEIQDDCFECCVNLQMADHSIDPETQSLQQSPYKTYRLCTKFLCFLLLYILLMYMFYLKDNITILFKQSDLQRANITISTINYEIITEDISQFYLEFNQTSRLYNDLKGIGCLINSYNGGPDYGNIVKANSMKWLVYLVGGLVVFLVVIVLKSLLIFKFDYIKAKYNYQHGITNFNYSNYLIINLLVAALINQHFSFFNLIFYTTLPACLGNVNSKIYSSVEFMLNQDQRFLYVHLPAICGLILVTLLHFFMVYKTDKVKYSKIYNPIILFSPFLLGYWIIVRLGVLPTFFYPSALNDSQDIIKNYFKTGDYVGILGILPQILFLLEIIINKLIDMFYWLLIDKKRRVMIHQSSTQNIQLFQ